MSSKLSHTHLVGRKTCLGSLKYGAALHENISLMSLQIYKVKNKLLF